MTPRARVEIALHGGCADKVLWLNFPSSVHLRSDAAVTATTVSLFEEAGRPDGLLMGITENMPPQRWQQSCAAIMDGRERHARERPELYRKNPAP